MPSVTVLGASGTITVPFKSQANASLAQQLASHISAAINGGTLYTADYNTTEFVALPTEVGGVALGQQVIGDNDPASVPGGEIQNPAGYPVIIANNTDPVTVNGAPRQVARYSIMGGDGGLTFHGHNSSLGGVIYVGGGVNELDGSYTGSTAPDSTNGGLLGNWKIGTGDDDRNSSTTIRLAIGNDKVFVGGNDTISTGAANVRINVSDTPGAKATVFLGGGQVTFFGGSGAGDLILGQGVATGEDVIVLGQGGNRHGCGRVGQRHPGRRRRRRPHLR